MSNNNIPQSEVRLAERFAKLFGRQPGEPLFPVAREGEQYLNAYFDEAGNWVFPNAETAPEGLMPVTIQLHELAARRLPVVSHEYGHGVIDR